MVPPELPEEGEDVLDSEEELDELLVAGVAARLGAEHGGTGITWKDRPSLRQAAGGCLE